MNRIKKIVCLLLVVIMMFAMSACGKAGKWIAKTSEIELPVGLYIYYLAEYYEYASYLVEDTSKSPLSQNVVYTDEDDKEVRKNAAEWIEEMTLNTCRVILSILTECEKKGITLTVEELDKVREAAKNEWNNYGTSLEQYGISKSSIEFLYRYNTLLEKYYDSLFGPEGSEKVVTDAEVKTFFEEKYSHIEYFSYYLGSNTTNSDYDSMVQYAKDLAAQVSAGTITISKALEKYNAAYSDTKTLTDEHVQTEKDYQEDFYKNFINLPSGSCVSFTFDNYAYIVYKHDIKEDSEYFDENLAYIRRQMYSDEFNELLKTMEENLVFESNAKAIKKYSAKWFEKLISSIAAG